MTRADSRWVLPGACATALLCMWQAPHWLDSGTLRLAAEVLLAVGLAQMWNLLAGYTGLMSMGHHLFVALGSYALFEAARTLQIPPFAALPMAALAGAASSALLALLLFRLREAYFAIGMWVFAEIGALLVSKSQHLGGSTGLMLDSSMVTDIDAYQATTFRLSAAVGLGLLLLVWALMRSRFGLALLTVRDNELAACSIGVDVRRVHLLAFVVSGSGCALAGATYHLGGLLVSPDTAFDINWTVMMMFATLIGGIGTLTGPVVGVLVWYALREGLTTGLNLSGSWYLILMGVLAIVVTRWAPRGLWGAWVARRG